MAELAAGRVNDTTDVGVRRSEPTPGVAVAQPFRGQPGRTMPPGALLGLQRSAGNRAVVQRLIGFEIESRIPVYKVSNAGNVSNLNYNTLHADAGTGDGSELVVDKDGPTSIIEFVSGPVSDTQSAKAFKATARTWVGVLTNLRTEASAAPYAKQLNATHAPASNKVRYGKLNGGSSVLGYDKVAIQGTHGLQLEKVKAFIHKTSLANPTGAGRVTKKNQALQETRPSTEAIMTALRLIVDPTVAMPSSKGRALAIKQAEGFFALLAHYLTLGGKDIQAYLKNQVTLFYKSELSDVRTANLSNRWLFELLYYADTRGQVQAALLTGTNRVAGTPLFRGSVVQCGQWLTAVLAGTGDPFFQEAKNSWGTPIAPGQVKGRNAVVLEHRDLTSEMPFTDRTNLDDPEEVVRYLGAVFAMNKKRQGL